MARPVSPELYPDTRPLTLLSTLLPLLRRLRVLFYLTLALAFVAVAGPYLPLGTWLFLSGSIATPVIASVFLIVGNNEQP
jgi:hypothetical protein